VVIKMAEYNRRKFLKKAINSSIASSFVLPAACRLRNEKQQDDISMARFRFDVTPPIGHSCCGGWIEPVNAVDDPLEALGVVILGAGKPIVICAVDWTGLLNDAHFQWRRALAKAANTTIDRVAVQCVHQHNAPFACLEAERIVQEEENLPHIIEPDFFQDCLDRGSEAVKRSLIEASPVTHIASGQGKVEKVASNRRINRDDSGLVQSMRGSSCKDEALRSMEEGLIDPWLKTVAFYNRDKKIAAFHYYATHPMSYYGDGRVSSDFAGLARKQRQQDEKECLHVYFNGCAGNVAAGKYNDGSPEMRPILTERIYKGILASEENLQPEPIKNVGWKEVGMLPTARSSLSKKTLQHEISDIQNSLVKRLSPAYRLSWLHRLEEKLPIAMSAMHINGISMLHLPAECFVQYQLRAQKMQPSRFVATAAYGDGGPWYIPTKEEFSVGGYEVSQAYCEPEIDGLISRSLESLFNNFNA
jgi:hypothetical protein